MVSFSAWWREHCLGGDTAFDERTALQYGTATHRERCTPCRALGFAALGLVMLLLLMFPIYMFGFGLQGGRQHHSSASSSALDDDDSGAASSGSFFKPFSTAAPPFPHTTCPVPVSPYWGSGFSAPPLPTCTAWQGTMLPGDATVHHPDGSTTLAPNYAQGIVNTWPYFVHVSNTSGPSVSMVAVDGDMDDCSQPYSYCVYSNKTLNTKEYRPGATTGIPTFSAASGPFTSYTVRRADFLSVEYEWKSDKDSGHLRVPLAYGSPFVTAVYTDMQARLSKPPGPALLLVNGSDVAARGGEPFSISTAALNWTLATDYQQHWVFYTQDEVKWSCTTEGCTTDEKSLVVRVAHNPTARHFLYRGAYASGGELQVEVDDDDASIAFKWRVEGDGPLATYALPHHRAALASSTSFDQALSVHTGLAGKIWAVVGSTWKMSLKLSAIGKSFWDPDAAISVAHADAIRAQLQADKPAEPIANQDPYTFGKRIARLARLALIAKQLGEDAYAMEVAQLMEQSLGVALGFGDQSTNEDPLLYETRYGGVCSQSGIEHPGEPWGPGGARDFGNGIYNDHHYHWGYWIYAIAAAAEIDPAWLASDPQLKSAALALVRDIANPSSTDDAYFTAFRYKDWFTGHSWASGLQALADGTNQESISEAINGYYGVALLGRALGDPHMEAVGRVLLETEVAAAHAYWQVMPADTAIYPAEFAQLGLAAQLWADKATYAVFFECPGTTACTYGINVIPVTPLSARLLQPQWVAATYQYYATANFQGLEAWRGFLIADHAVIDPAAAWNETLAYEGPYDGGMSLSNLMHFVATQPGA